LPAARAEKAPRDYTVSNLGSSLTVHPSGLPPSPSTNVTRGRFSINNRVYLKTEQEQSKNTKL